jgi:hypothetical protein
MSPHLLRPPFTRTTAVEKVRLAADGWNSRDPEKVSLAYSPDSEKPLRGLMRLRLASSNDLPIKESERLCRWPLGRRPDRTDGLRGEKQPGDGIGRRRVGTFLQRAEDLAAIGPFPMRAGVECRPILSPRASNRSASGATNAHSYPPA